MEKIDIEELNGFEFDSSKIGLLAEKLNEVIDKLNKLESFTGDNLK